MNSVLDVLRREFEGRSISQEELGFAASVAVHQASGKSSGLYNSQTLPDGRTSLTFLGRDGPRFLKKTDIYHPNGDLEITITTEYRLDGKRVSGDIERYHPDLGVKAPLSTREIQGIFDGRRRWDW